MAELIYIATIAIPSLSIGFILGFILRDWQVSPEKKVNQKRLIVFLVVPLWIFIVVLEVTQGAPVPWIVHGISGAVIGGASGFNIKDLWKK